MSSFCDDNHTDYTGICYLACTEQCSCSSCSREVSTLRQTCSQCHPSQFFPTTQCHRELASVHFQIPDNNVLFGSAPQQFPCHRTTHLLQLDNLVCRCEGLEHDTWSLMHPEDFSKDFSFSAATELWNVTSSELDQLFSSASADQHPSETNQPIAASVDLDTCSWNVSPVDLLSLGDNNQSGFATLFPELSRSFNEPTPQLGPVEPHASTDGRRNEHVTERSILCPEELEASNLVETFCTMDAESSMSLYLATGGLDANSQTIWDNHVCTAESPDTTLLLNNHSMADPRLTCADSTSLLTTPAMPSQCTPANMIANIPVEAVRVSRTGQDSYFRALKCPFPSCTSKTLFIRTCDLNKHYRQHFKRFFCRIKGCHMSEQAATDGGNHGLSRGFALKKDRARHEASHDPSIRCEVCGKVFSRADNMQSHMQRIHKRYFSS